MMLRISVQGLLRRSRVAPSSITVMRKNYFLPLFFGMGMATNVVRSRYFIYGRKPGEIILRETEV